jgi:GNAT superfamily N-acetyltransferase
MFDRITPNERADYREIISFIAGAVWPEFMRHDPVVNRHWEDLYIRFPEYQFALLDIETGEVWAFIQSVADHEAGHPPRTQCAIQIAIAPDYQRRGLSSSFVREMGSIGASQGLQRLIAPVRPSLKSRYPLMPMDRYIQWEDPNGLPFDPWLRVHTRLGAKLVKTCHQSMRVIGTVAEWESWTEIVFPESGPYVVPGALVPVEFDLAADSGTYIEPNVWMVHEVE